MVIFCVLFVLTCHLKAIFVQSSSRKAFLTVVIYREEAQPKFEAMVASNRRSLWLTTMPYKVGIFAAVTAGFASIPLIFDYNTVLWFNELYVTSGEFSVAVFCVYRSFTSRKRILYHIVKAFYLSTHSRSLSVTLLCLFSLDVPEAKDLETPLEVGSFAWNWMEPPLVCDFFNFVIDYSSARSCLFCVDQRHHLHVR